MSRSGMVGMMTDPSPQSELRAEIAAVLAVDVGDARAAHIADQLLPLFAARVAAIEAAGEAKSVYWRWKSQEFAEALVKAEADLTATQERLATFTAEHDRVEDLLAATTMRAQRAEERIAALTAACRDGNRGCCVDGTCCACCDRAQQAEERVAAERKQSAAQAASLEYDLEYSRKHLPHCHHGVVLAYADCRNCRLEEGIPTL